MVAKVSSRAVFGVADRLVAQGLRPTSARVRLELRRSGHLEVASPETVGLLLDTWWHSIAQRMRGQLTEVPESVSGAFAAVWQQALIAARASAIQEGEQAGLAAVQNAQREGEGRQVELLEQAHVEAEDAREAAAQFELKIADLETRLYLQAYELAELSAQRDAERIRAIDLELCLAHFREELATRTASSKSDQSKAKSAGKTVAVVAKSIKASGRQARQNGGETRA
jgi:hypothetical protein